MVRFLLKGIPKNFLDCLSTYIPDFHPRTLSSQENNVPQLLVDSFWHYYLFLLVCLFAFPFLYAKHYLSKNICMYVFVPLCMQTLCKTTNNWNTIVCKTVMLSSFMFGFFVANSKPKQQNHQKNKQQNNNNNTTYQHRRDAYRHSHIQRDRQTLAKK